MWRANATGDPCARSAEPGYRPTPGLGYGRGVLTRRDLLAGSWLGLAAACTRRVRPASRLPRVTHGVQVGDVQPGRALVWARCDEPARMIVEWDTSPRFTRPRVVAGPVATPASDGTTTLLLDGLPDAQTIA